MSSGLLNPPPADLTTIVLKLVDFDQSFFRSHSVLRHPIFYGKTGLYRFDAPDGSYGVLYAGADDFCAFVESLIKNPDNHIITTAELKKMAIAELRAVRPLRLIDLTFSGALKHMGADSRLFSADHKVAQLWSKALNDHPCVADGILYPSRLDPVRQSLAIFDRSPRLQELSRQGWYDPGSQRRRLAEIAEHYKINLIENHFIATLKPISIPNRSELLFKPEET